MLSTPNTARIPADEHGLGFTTVAITFPAEPDAHRIERIYHPAIAADEAPEGTGELRAWTEVRPACRPDSDPDQRFYELSVPYALARGAIACDRPECFGGAA